MMGSAQATPNKVNLDAVQLHIKQYNHHHSYSNININLTASTTLLITTLPTSQQCLIYGTLNPQVEEETMNLLVQKGCFDKHVIIIYGMNATDNRPYDKYMQLQQLGFKNVSIYCGGLFEWLLLHDIFDPDIGDTFTNPDTYIDNCSFPITHHETDILKYSGCGQKMLQGPTM